MSQTAFSQETYLPGAAGPVTRVRDFLVSHNAPRYFLEDQSRRDRVELPPEIYRALRLVVDALRQGLAVTVAPTGQTLTTQQAADLLGVSRPTVIKLLAGKKIPYERAGSHRRIMLRDLLAYREQRRAEQYAALEAAAKKGTANGCRGTAEAASFLKGRSGVQRPSGHLCPVAES
ncbi:MAG TPA: excisionase family DNA-binding protein [Candidatus Limnocylindrales bacterium]